MTHLPTRADFNAGFVANGESDFKQTPSDAPMERPRRDLFPTPSYFDVVCPVFFERIGSEIRPDGCAVLRVIW